MARNRVLDVPYNLQYNTLARLAGEERFIHQPVVKTLQRGHVRY
jgi:hypothetical protein